MKKLWNSKCVIFDINGNVYESNTNLKNHNESISECAKNLDLVIDPNQSLVSILNELSKMNNIILLNAGCDENEKRTGYLALPESITEYQVERCEELKLILDEYSNITVWQTINKNIKTISFGNPHCACLSLQNLIDNVLVKEVKNENKI